MLQTILELYPSETPMNGIMVRARILWALRDGLITSEEAYELHKTVTYIHPTDTYDGKYNK